MSDPLDLVAGERDEPSGAGCRACSTARTTARKAWASMARVTQRRGPGRSGAPGPGRDSARSMTAQSQKRCPFGTGPGRQLLPGSLGHLRGQGIRAELPRIGGDFMRAGDGEHVADVALFQRGAQLRVAAVDSSAATQPTRCPASGNRPVMGAASSGLYAKTVSSSKPAARQRVRIARPRARDVQLPVTRR